MQDPQTDEHSRVTDMHKDSIRLPGASNNVASYVCSVFLFLSNPESNFNHTILCIARTVLSKMSVCSSVCLFVTRQFVSNRLNISLFHPQVATPVKFFTSKRHGNIPTETSLTGASNVGEGMKKIAIYLGNNKIRPCGMRIGNRINAF